MQGHVSRPEKEEKEEIYQEQWPDYLKQLTGRYFYYFKCVASFPVYLRFALYAY